MYKKYVLIGFLVVLAIALFVYIKKSPPSGGTESENNLPSKAMGENEKPRGKHVEDSEEVFVVSMISRHQEAIDSSQIILENSSNKELVDLAQKIIDTQTKELVMMKKWLTDWYPYDALQSMYENTMPDLTNIQGDTLDKAYLEGMIEHHQGVVQLITDFLLIPEHKIVVEMQAKKIMNTQLEEIVTMQELLSELE